jgi:hypothetical protein
MQNMMANTNPPKVLLFFINRIKVPLIPIIDLMHSPIYVILFTHPH